MAAVGKVAPAVWFEHLFGFKEHLALRQQLPNGQIVRNPAHLREKLELRGDRLVSLVNGASYGVGTFSAPSLSELRRRVAAANLPPGQLQLSHIATRDVFSLHSQPEYRGATFMAASQFNCLEFSNPEVVPEDGVQNYVYDATQGPACALAAPAAAVVRHYHIPVGGEVGQSAERQLNLVSGLLQAVQGTDGEQWRRRGGAVEAEAVDLVCVRNGYSTSDESRLLELNRRWRAACEQAPLTARDEAMGQMCIGVHAGVEVPWGPPRFMLLPLEQRQSVTQAYCSALAVGYSEGSEEAWAPLAQLVLEASYEAVLLCAALDQAEAHGSGLAVLTFLGGGVFGNRPEWIEAAIARAVVRLHHLGIRVELCHFGEVDQRAVARLESAIAAERNN